MAVERNSFMKFPFLFAICKVAGSLVASARRKENTAEALLRFYFHDGKTCRRQLNRKKNAGNFSHSNENVIKH